MDNENGVKEEKPKIRKTKKRPASPLPKGRSPLMTAGIAAIVTSLVVGSGIYVWQKKSINSNISKVNEDARVARLDFENRLANIKEKLTGVESENENLKAQNEELARKTQLLAAAKLEYKNESLGIRFEYPAIFGEVKITEVEGSAGKMLRGSFSANEKLLFGAVTDDFVRSSTSTKAVFLDTRGFKKEKNNYYFSPIADAPASDYRMIPMKVLKIGEDEALLVSKESFPVDKTENGEPSGAGAVEIGEDVGLMINLEKGPYPAVAFQNSDLGSLPLEMMEGIANSFKNF